jgi:hypothetical protein
VDLQEADIEHRLDLGRLLQNQKTTHTKVAFEAPGKDRGGHIDLPFDLTAWSHLQGILPIEAPRKATFHADFSLKIEVALMVGIRREKGPQGGGSRGK